MFNKRTGFYWVQYGLLSCVSQKIVAAKWRIYKGKCFCQIEPLSRDRARILYLIILWFKITMSQSLELRPDGLIAETVT